MVKKKNQKSLTRKKITSGNNWEEKSSFCGKRKKRWSKNAVASLANGKGRGKAARKKGGGGVLAQKAKVTVPCQKENPKGGVSDVHFGGGGVPIWTPSGGRNNKKEKKKIQEEE